MKSRPCFFVNASLAAAVLFIGCGRQHDHDPGQGHDHDHAHDHAGHDHDEGHGHAHGTASGASFKAGQGVILSGETRTNLGLEIARVSQRALANQVRLTIQMFGEKHRHVDTEDHTGCDMHGSGFLSTNAAVNVKSGLPVQLFKGTNHSIRGVVLAAQRAIALGEIEVVVGVSNATSILSPGEFVSGAITISRDQPVPAIPASALLRTAEGTFVYVVNGEAYLRKAVKVGAEADGWIEIVEGPREGDDVVTNPVQTLWLIELRATKGGGHSH